MNYYFAYGSNMSVEQMQTRMAEGPDILKKKNLWKHESTTMEKMIVIGRCALKDYELVFNKTAGAGTWGYANISLKAGSICEGVLYEIDNPSMDALDHYEGVSTNHYERKTVVVRSVTTRTFYEATAYVAHPSRIADCRPTPEYIGKLLKGVEEFNLDPDMKTSLKNLSWLAALPFHP